MFKIGILFVINSFISSLIPLAILNFSDVVNYNQFNTFQIFINLMLLISTLGFDKYYFRNYTELSSEANLNYYESKLVKTILIIGLILSFVAFFYTKNIIMMTCILSYGIYISLSRVIQIEQRFVKSKKQIINYLILPKLIILLAIILNIQDYKVILTFAPLLVTFIYICRKVNWNASKNVDDKNYAIKSLLTGIVLWVFFSVDRLTLEYELVFYNVESYLKIINIANLAMILQLLITSLWIPKKLKNNKKNKDNFSSYFVACMVISYSIIDHYILSILVVNIQVGIFENINVNHLSKLIICFILFSISEIYGYNSFALKKPEHTIYSLIIGIVSYIIILLITKDIIISVCALYSIFYIFRIIFAKGEIKYMFLPITLVI